MKQAEESTHGTLHGLWGAVRTIYPQSGALPVRAIKAGLWDLIVLILILGVAATFRLVNLNAFGYSGDEAVYAGQAAAIAQHPVLKTLFPVFRAHPLLFQVILALVFHDGLIDWYGRLAEVVIGLATVYLVWKLAKMLYGRWSGVLAALFMAVMPYHVIVTRQVLLDGPMVLCATLTIYLVARFAMTEEPVWLHATGIGLGLTFLMKETGLVLIGAVYAFLALAPQLRIRFRDLLLSVAFMLLVIAPYPLSLRFAAPSGIGQQYLVWQLFRRPNHAWDFYWGVVAPSLGYFTILAALAGFWLLRRERSWRETLLVAWIVVPLIFFQLWPTKGFQYLLPIAAPVAILAARTAGRWSIESPAGSPGARRLPLILNGAIAGLLTVSLILPSWRAVHPAASTSYLAGSGGIPGGREAGTWILENTPQGVSMLTIGPSLANILQFYGHRTARGLSVSPNPLHRNPVYQPVINPDWEIRSNNIQYLIWDSYSAARSGFFSDRLLELATQFHGRVVHTESIMVPSEGGSTVSTPVIVIYEVRP
jgi:hypothetical protein